MSLTEWNESMNYHGMRIHWMFLLLRQIFIPSVTLSFSLSFLFRCRYNRFRYCTEAADIPLPLYTWVLVCVFDTKNRVKEFFDCICERCHEMKQFFFLYKDYMCFNVNVVFFLPFVNFIQWDLHLNKLRECNCML